MDNNNFQPQPNMNPTGMGQRPMPQPMNPQPMQPMQPMGPQPMPRPPKQPMDPVKKKKLILELSIGSGALALIILAAILIPILTRIDYAPAYSTAKELKPKIYDIHQDHNCQYVVDYVTSSIASVKTYNEYIENCKTIYNSGTDDLVAKLENTAAVKRNQEIGVQFEKFKSEYATASSGNAEDLEVKLNLWQARHNFYIAADLNYGTSSDAEFTTAATYLIESGNDSLKAYGEGWLERSLELAAAYRAYDSAAWGSKSQPLAEFNNKKAEFVDWVAANMPDINAIAPLDFNDTSKMYSEFNNLYDLIAATYALNYNSGSGDCTEFLGEIICD